MRKLISWLSAAAIVSSVIVIPMSASAAGEEVLWSDTFNGYTNTVTHYTSPEGIGNVLVDGTQTAGNTYTGIGGIILATTSRADDSSYFQLVQHDENPDNLYLTTTISRFARQSAGSSIVFNDTYAAEDGKDVVLAFKLLLTNSGETGYDNTITVGSTAITLDAAALGVWHDVKVVVTTDGTSVYLDDSDTPAATSADTSIYDIRFNSYINGAIASDAVKAASHPFGYPVVGLDDAVIYTSADGVNSEVPEASDQEEVIATEAPTPAPPAEITDTVSFDFETDDATILPSDSNNLSAITVGAPEGVLISANGEKVLSVEVSSGSNSTYGKGKIDLSAYTTGKSRVVLSYDSYVVNTGRMTVSVLQTDEPAAYDDGGVFSTGIKDSSGFRLNGAVNTGYVATWLHNEVDINLADGTGTYTITKTEDGSAVTSGTISNVTAVKSIGFVSNSAGIAYLDNLTIATGGSMEVVTITPEPASEAEGSGIDLVSETAREQISSITPDGAETTKVLNHSSAYAIPDGAVINAYSSNAKGYTVVAAYDVYVDKGDVLNLQTYNGTSLGAQFIITGNSDGTASAAVQDSSAAARTFSTDLVCGTWYRAVIEIPQTSEGATGEATFTIYRIDAEDPHNTASVAAQVTGVAARNLASRGLVQFTAAVTGTPYVDNGVVYLDTTVISATPEPASEVEGSGINLLPETAREQISSITPEGAETTKVLNHSSAYAIPNEAVIDTYSSSAKGYTVVTAYDVYVDKGDVLNLQAYNGTSLGAQFIITGNADGTASAAVQDSSADARTFSTDLVCGTWYRAVIEIPQTSEGATGEATFTIYRIDAENPFNTASVAAQVTGVAARNLNNKGLVQLTAAVTGTPYVDNGVVYLKKALADTWYRYTYTKDENGVLTDIAIETVDEPEKKLPTAGVSYLWNALMQPYVAADTETVE